MRFAEERKENNDTTRRGGGMMIDEVAKLIKEKQRLYKLYEKSKKDEDRIRVEELRRTYQTAKYEAKKAVYKAQEEARKEFGEMLENEDKKGTVFRVAKQMVRSY